MSDIKQLIRFSASSANDENYKHLWVIGASLYIGQLNGFLDYSDYKPIIIPVENFANPSMDELRDILNKHQSDKASTHNYNILYGFIFNQLGKNNKLNILEIGLGTNDPLLVSTMGSGARPGASLYGWNEYCPDSNIYGADIDKNILFQRDKIKTSYVNQLAIESFDTMQKNFNNVSYDLIVDDGLHSIGANLNTLLFGLKNLNVNGWIVVEDIRLIDNWHPVDHILSANKKYKTYIIKAARAYVYAVNKIAA
jgi:hypothetical protein